MRMDERSCRRKRLGTGHRLPKSGQRHPLHGSHPKERCRCRNSSSRLRQRGPKVGKNESFAFSLCIIVNIFVSRKYNLLTLFYETVEDDGKYLTVPIVNKMSGIKTFKDLRGKKACFPMYDGVAWNTVIQELEQRKLISGCPYEEAIANFFGDSCVPDSPWKYGQKLQKLCRANEFRGDDGALNCLKDGIGDVAFVSENNLRNFILGE